MVRRVVPCLECDKEGDAGTDGGAEMILEHFSSYGCVVVMRKDESPTNQVNGVSFGSTADVPAVSVDC